MSVSSLTTLSAVRDVRPPTKGDVGKEPKGDEEEKKEPGVTDLLVTAVPTELVAPYTALTAVIVGAIDEPTKRVLEPDLFEGWRWLIFVALVLATGAAIWRGNKKKSSSDRFPTLEITAGIIAAAGWALALPNSPLIPYLDGAAKSFAPLVMGFLAIAAIVGLAGKLKKQAT